MAEARVAIIGGSGFYQMDALEAHREVHVETPFGSPSDEIVLGRLGGVDVAFLARHGQGHRLLASEVPSRANIYALKTLGVERIISVNAVGSLREEHRAKAPRRARSAYRPHGQPPRRSSSAKAWSLTSRSLTHSVPS